MTREEAIQYNKNLREYMRITDKESEYKFLEENYIALNMAIKALEQEPRKGHWIEHPHEAGANWEFSMYECSECRVWEEDDSNYCPNCGADMSEGEQ